jgi:hypothetical protein
MSCTKIVKNYNVIPAEPSNEFLSLTSKFERTDDEKKYLEYKKEIVDHFPHTSSWLQLWLQPSVSSMIFPARKVMKTELQKHPSRAINAIESYHSHLYRLIPKRKPILNALVLTLQFAKNHSDLLQNYYEFQVRLSYKL